MKPKLLRSKNGALRLDRVLAIELTAPENLTVTMEGGVRFTLMVEGEGALESALSLWESAPGAPEVAS